MKHSWILYFDINKQIWRVQMHLKLKNFPQNTAVAASPHFNKQYFNTIKFKFFSNWFLYPMDYLDVYFLLSKNRKIF